MKRLAQVRPFAIDPIKTFLLRQAKYQWLVLGTFAQLNLSHYGRFALDNAVLERIEIPGHTMADILRVRSSTPDHNGILREVEHQKELWNLFFLAMWAEFEAAVDDIRTILLANARDLSRELLGTDVEMESAKLGKRLRDLAKTDKESRFVLDMKTYELLGFSPLDTKMVAVLVEANAVRNVLLHRRGAIDARALTECDTLSTHASPIILDKDRYIQYWTATSNWAQAYLADLISFDKANAAP